MEDTPATANLLAAKANRMAKRFRVWARRVHLGRNVVIGLTIASLLSGLATIATMTSASPFRDDLGTVLTLLYLDLILLLLLGVVVARRLVRVWLARKRGSAGSRLHVRFVALFGLVAVTPAIIVAVFSGVFLNFGLQSWFSERVRTAINESQAVAQAYLLEHQQNIRADALAMANDINRAAPQLRRNPNSFTRMLSAQANIRSLPEAIVINGSGRTLARSGLSFALEFELLSRQLLQRTLSRIRPGEVQVINSSPEGKVRAGLKLDGFIDTYLFVGRFVAPQVLEHIARSTGAAAQYKQLEIRRDDLQVTFILIFVVVALLLLLAAIWVGLSIANQLATPIIDLISAAERVREGDLSVRVDTSVSTDEIGTLARAFNRMTGQLATQQKGLIDANRQLDERRHFTETVLLGVSAGVIGLDRDGCINLPNRSASQLLGTDLDQCLAQPLADVVPEMAALLESARRRPEKAVQGEISVARDNRPRTLMVNIRAERMGAAIHGFVVTFDDVTELLSAQRKAAWADVAQRIAHEIKNPLTPIQLSAERLQRKYKDEILSDPETFKICVDTIVRQVRDIGRMVDEFSAFARMPQPEFKLQDLGALCAEAFHLERNRFPDITYEYTPPEDPVELQCDRHLIGRALTNILKNAAESILDRDDDGNGPLLPGEICLTIQTRDGDIVVSVADNGRGLPEEDVERLTEPYVTTRAKGTGLGLAIAKRIMEDHNGEISLRNREGGGVEVSLLFHEFEGAATATNDEKKAVDPMTISAEKIAHGA